MIGESHFEKDRWRMPLIAYERPVNYPLETSVFDINSTSVIRTSSNDGADEGWILDYQRMPTIYGILSKKSLRRIRSFNRQIKIFGKSHPIWYASGFVVISFYSKALPNSVASWSSKIARMVLS